MVFSTKTPLSGMQKGELLKYLAERTRRRMPWRRK
jgi:hypothetical protein